MPGRVNRENLFKKVTSEAMASHGLVDKLLAIATFLAFFAFVEIPARILSKLGWKTRANGGIEQVYDNVYQMTYDDRKGNITILRGKDGNLLLLLAPRPTRETVESIRALGKEISVLLLSDEFHETFAHEFVQAVNEIQGKPPLVICPERVRAATEEAVHVSSTWESWSDSEKKNWGLEDFIDPDTTRAGSTGTFIGSFPDGSKYALQTCGIANIPLQISNIVGYVSMGLGRGLIRMARLTWTKNLPKLREHWRLVSSIDNLRLVTFMHGEPIKGTQSQIQRQMRVVLDGI